MATASKEINSHLKTMRVKIIILAAFIIGGIFFLGFRPNLAKAISGCCHNASLNPKCQDVDQPTKACPNSSYIWADGSCGSCSQCGCGANAQTSSNSNQGEVQTQKESPPVVPIQEVPIPGLTFTNKIEFCSDTSITDISKCPINERTLVVPWLSQYIVAIYKWALRAIAILAIFMIMLGGVQWIISRGSPTGIASAKSKIGASIIAVVIILCVNIILSLINPELTILKPIIIGRIATINYDAIRSGTAPTPTGPLGSGCPTDEEKRNGFTAQITAYYSPIYGDRGHTSSFECNVAIECGCPGVGRDTSIICAYDPNTHKPIYSCKSISQTAFQGMCKSTPRGGTLENFVSAAADVDYGANTWGLKCFNWDEHFEVIGSSHSELNKVWTIVDTGSAIVGRHFDLYVGNDENARSLSGNLNENVTIKFVP